MRRWVLWFLLAPHGFLLAGIWRDAGLPPIDFAVPACVFLGLVADRRASPWLVFGAALGRAVVDEASLPAQILVLGIPVAVLLPLRSVFSGQAWVMHALAAALAAVAVPKLALLCGRVFDEPSSGAALEGMTVLWSAILVPPLLALGRRLPPCRAFVEVP